MTSLPASDMTNPCPESDPSGGVGQDTLAEETRLEPMLSQVLAYGGKHPDEFGTYGLVWHGGDDASVFISFSSDVPAHRAALEAIVEHPDELIVCQAAVSGAVAQGIEATLVKELEGRYLGIGRGAGPIEVALAANEEVLAGDLLSRYGDAIEVTVGALAYPLENAQEVCEDPPADEDLHGLRIEVAAPTDPVSAAGVTPLQLSVVLTNEGESRIQFGSGTAIGTILNTSGDVVANSLTVAVDDAGIVVDLGPGESMELPLLVSTASCDPALGYALPPGEYQLVAAVQHSNGNLTTLHSRPVPILVSDA